VVVAVVLVAHQNLVDLVVPVVVLEKTALLDLEPKVMHHHFLLDMVMMVEVLEDKTMHQVAVVLEAQV
jgi:hypothetical protein